MFEESTTSLLPLCSSTRIFQYLCLKDQHEHRSSISYHDSTQLCRQNLSAEHSSHHDWKPSLGRRTLCSHPSWCCICPSLTSSSPSRPDRMSPGSSLPNCEDLAPLPSSCLWSTMCCNRCRTDSSVRYTESYSAAACRSTIGIHTITCTALTGRSPHRRAEESPRKGNWLL